MNISIEMYLKGLEQIGDKLPEVFPEWNQIEIDLQDEYLDSINWMIDQEIRIKNLSDSDKCKIISINNSLLQLKELLVQIGVDNIEARLLFNNKTLKGE